MGMKFYGKIDNDKDLINKEFSDTHYMNQYSTMPTASADYKGRIVEYIGETDSNYNKGSFYICLQSGSTYKWSIIKTDTGIIKVTSLPTTGIDKNNLYLLILGWTEIGRYSPANDEEINSVGMKIDGALVHWDTIAAQWSTYYPSHLTDNTSGDIYRYTKQDGTNVLTYLSATLQNGLYYFDDNDSAWVQVGGSGSGSASSVRWGGISGSISNQTDLADRFTTIGTSINNVNTRVDDIETDMLDKQDKEDDSLATTAKTVTGGINELKTKVDNLSSAVQYKGVVNSTSDLPTSAEVGDMYFVKSDSFYILGSDGTWQSTGSTTDTSNLVDLSSTQTITGAKTFTASTTYFQNTVKARTFYTDNAAKLYGGISLISNNNVKISSAGIIKDNHTAYFPTLDADATLATTASLAEKQNKLATGNSITIDDNNKIDTKIEIIANDSTIGNYITNHNGRTTISGGYIYRVGQLLFVRLNFKFNSSAKTSYAGNESWFVMKTTATFQDLIMKSPVLEAGAGVFENVSQGNMSGMIAFSSSGGQLTIFPGATFTVSSTDIWNARLCVVAKQ